MKSDESAPLPTTQQIDAILLFRHAFQQEGVKHSRWHRESGKMPWCELSEEATAFQKALHQQGFVVPSDWKKWQNEARRYVIHPEDLSGEGLLTIRRLLTFHVRQDRFCEGHFAAMIANGHIAAILRQLGVIRCEMDGGLVLDDILDSTDMFPAERAREYPWEDVDAARRRRRLQAKHPVQEWKSHYLSDAKPCRKCEAPPEALAWFYFESPKETWEGLCGTAGWMAVCDRCHVQANYFEEVMS